MVPRNIRKVTLALVGTGRWGSNYIKTISSLKNCVLPKEYIVTRKYKELAKHQDIDGVIIATPASTHYEIAKFFLENRFNVLIEKPVTLNFYQAQELIMLQHKNKVVGMVGHVYEYHPGFQKLFKTVNRSKITYIYTEGVGNGPVRKDISALWDWAPHDVGICIRIADGNPISVACWEQVKNAMYFLKLVFPSGITAVCRIGWLASERKRSVLVLQKNEVLNFTDTGTKVSSKSPLAYEMQEFVRCITKKKIPLTDFACGAAIVRVTAALEKSLKRGGKIVHI